MPLDILILKISKVLHNFQAFSLQYKPEPILPFIHLQPAQISTVDKRHQPWQPRTFAYHADLILSAGWAQDHLIADLVEPE